MSPWTAVLPNLWVGDIVRPFRGEFDYVLTVGGYDTPTDDGLRHRHIPVPVDDVETHALINTAVEALERRWHAGNRLLIQSPGRQLACVIACALVVHLGATLDEAILLLRRSLPQGPTDPQHLQLLRNWRETRA